MTDSKSRSDVRLQSKDPKEGRRPFVKPRLERRSSLPKVTNGTAGTFGP